MPIQPIRTCFILCAISGAAWAQLGVQPGRPQIEQSRQFDIPIARVTPLAKPTDATDLETFDAQLDDAFGAQVILKESVIAKAFTAWAEVSGFYTNNVALARRGELQDTFLATTFGLAYRKALNRTIMFDASLRSSLYRYNRNRPLDFQSVDPSVSLTWSPQSLQNTAFYFRYTYNHLVSAVSGDRFFSSHSVSIGAQKAWALSRSHAIIAGAQAQWSKADPTDSQRDEYSAFLGIHAELTERLSADLSYRYAIFDFRETAFGRRDHNQSVTLAFRYALEDWLSVSASTFWTSNDSNFDVFGYEAWNLGGSLGLSSKF